MARKSNRYDDEKPFTRDDIHALATMTTLSEREREILYADVPATYEEYSNLFDKLMDDMDDYESAMRLRTKYSNLVEKHARKVIENHSLNEEPNNPVMASYEDIQANEHIISEAFPETHASTEEMISMGWKQIQERRKQKNKRREEAAELVEKFREKITDDATAMLLEIGSLSDWNAKCDKIKQKVLNGDENAIEGVFTVQKKGGLWDVNILAGAINSVFENI